VILISNHFRKKVFGDFDFKITFSCTILILNQIKNDFTQHWFLSSNFNEKNLLRYSKMHHIYYIFQLVLTQQ
jgi:hypothetical protein